MKFAYITGFYLFRSLVPMLSVKAISAGGVNFHYKHWRPFSCSYAMLLALKSLLQLTADNWPPPPPPPQLEPRSNSNQKSISPGFPSYIYWNFTLGNSNPR